MNYFVLNISTLNAFYFKHKPNFISVNCPFKLRAIINEKRVFRK